MVTKMKRIYFFFSLLIFLPHFKKLTNNLIKKCLKYKFFHFLLFLFIVMILLFTIIDNFITYK